MPVCGGEIAGGGISITSSAPYHRPCPALRRSSCRPLLPGRPLFRTDEDRDLVDSACTEAALEGMLRPASVGDHGVDPARLRLCRGRGGLAGGSGAEGSPRVGSCACCCCCCCCLLLLLLLLLVRDVLDRPVAGGQPRRLPRRVGFVVRIGGRPRVGCRPGAERRGPRSGSPLSTSSGNSSAKTEGGTAAQPDKGRAVEGSARRSRPCRRRVRPTGRAMRSALFQRGQSAPTRSGSAGQMARTARGIRAAEFTATRFSLAPMTASLHPASTARSRRTA